VVHKRYGPDGLVHLSNYSPVHCRAEYSIELFDKQHHHLGYGTEASLLVLDFAFNTLNLNNIYSLVYDYNLASGKMLQGLDFKSEGVLENHHYSVQDNTFVSLHTFALSVADFRHSQTLSRLSQKRTFASRHHPIFYPKTRHRYAYHTDTTQCPPFFAVPIPLNFLIFWRNSIAA